MLKMITKNQSETIEFAEKFAKKLHGGEVLALIGDLGAGKTTFVKGIAKGLGIKQNITSPTFVTMKEYTINYRPSTFNHMIHIDCYRLKSAEDALSLGITDYLGKKDSVVVIEWADKIKKILPKNCIEIKFKNLSNDVREIIFV